MSILLKTSRSLSRMDELKETKRVLGLTQEDDLEDVNPSILDAIASLIRTIPDDLLIDIDLHAGPARLGRLTCLEEECWEDMNLGRDPKLDDGGLARGLGGWRVYQMHCQKPDHKKAVEKRLKARAAREKRDAKVARENSSQCDRYSSRDVKPKRSALQASRSQDSVEGRPKSKEVIILDDSSDEDVKPIMKSTSAKARSKPGKQENAYAKPDLKPDLKPDVKPSAQSLRAPQNPPVVKRKRAFSLSDDDDVKPFELLPDVKPHVDAMNVDAKPQDFMIQPAENAAGHIMPGGFPAMQEKKEPGSQEHLVANSQPRIQAELQALRATYAERGGNPMFGQARIWFFERIQYLEYKLRELLLNPGAGATLNAPSDRIKQYCPAVAMLWADGASAAMVPHDLQALIVEQAQAAERAREEHIAAANAERELNRQLTAGGKDALTLHIEEAMEGFMQDQTVEAAMAYLGLNGGNSRLPGLEVSLMAHQIIGVSDMLKKERSRWKGGILADAMGLGKTVQAIAVSVANPPAPDSDRKAILVVAPVSLLGQWADEFAQKTSELGRHICIYHGPDKPQSTKTLKKYSVIITSYSTLVLDAPGSIRPKKKKKRSSDSEEDEKERRRKPHGPLFKMAFHRIILDESAVIRNPKTLSSIAVSELEATYRWSVTGTLVTNSLNDLFAHFRYLGAGELAHWETFRDKITKPEKRQPAVAARRAQAALRLHGIRRTKDSLIDGRPILQLPEKSIIVHECQLDDAERMIYNAIEQRAAVRLNRYIKAGTIMKSYHVVLLLLLRLKQVACHANLIVRKPGEPSNPNDLQIEAEAYQKDADATDPAECRARERERAMKAGGQELVDKLDNAMRRRDEELAEADDEEAAQQVLECAICVEPSNNPTITSCGHVYCSDCINNVLGNAIEQDEQLADAEFQRLNAAARRPCPCCRTMVSRDSIYSCAAFGDEPEVKAEEEDELLSQEKLDKEANGYLQGTKGGSDEEDELYDELEELQPVLPSTKMRKMQELLDDWLENTQDKILIFSQFTSFLDLVSVQLQSKGINHSVYDGRMSREEKDEAVSDFKRRGGPRVMLLSIKAGNVGLNLVCANKAIMLDLNWAYATEAQAMDRIHRIGQTRPVEIHRLVVQDSIDQRIWALQERKKNLGEAAFGEGTAKRQKMGLQDLVKLFGQAANDDDD